MDELTRELARRGAGPLPAPVPDRYLADFGRLVRRVPRAVVVATSGEQVAGAFAAARRLGVPVTVRGAGHSCAGQTVSGGLVVANAPGASVVPRLLDDGLVELPARARWRQVEAFLTARGRSVPVLADYLDLSVGGTLSVGGYGADSVFHGAQVDQVERLRLVTPDGTCVECSPAERGDVFGCALAGLGQVGAIETAVIRTVPYQPYTVLFTYRHAGLAELVESLSWLAEFPGDRPLLFKALHARGRYVTTYGVPAATFGAARRERSQPPVAGRHPASAWIIPRYRQWRSLVVSLWLARFRGHSRLWSDYIFDYAGLRAFTSFLEPLLAEPPLAGCLKSLYVMAIRKVPRAVPFPLEATDAIRAPMCFGIGLYSMIPAGDRAMAARVADIMSRCLARCRDLGGRPYRYGWHQLDETLERAIYGTDFDRLAAVRRSLDPDGRFRRDSPPSPQG